ncbi:hypothetical protein [Spongiimicrobium sp. 2-473A-2-J]|uniref:hypothetical protein n=1 Tax=Eudoraea algarum TaxID=3417568 RepID=UPI003D3648F7
MGGEGSMAHAIQSLKQNRSLLKKSRSFKELRNSYLKWSGDTQLKFKEVSPEEMALIRLKIREQYKKDVRTEIIIYLISILLALGILYFLYWWIFV